MSSARSLPPAARRPVATASRRLLPVALAVLGLLVSCARTGGTPPGASPGAAPSTSRTIVNAGSQEQKSFVPELPTDPALRDTETALLAGGCFWGMEDLLREIPGVLQTDVGYAGGVFDNPTYRDVSSGRTGHAESVRVVFDPKKLSYETLLEKWFFRMHDPTTLNRQGNDVGTQYRSAIFYLSDEQRRVAEEVKARVNASGKWPRPVVTQVAPAGPFTPAEEYHQDYLVKNPGGYTCHYLRD